MKKFDIVLPVGIHEIPIIDKVVSYVKENVIGYNNIYLVSCDDNLQVEGCTTISETIFPFSKDSIDNIIGKFMRTYWIYMQLLKLHSVIVIKECLDDILIMDSDVFILNKLKFFTEDDKPIYTMGYENTAAYHVHSQKMHPTLTRHYPQYSGISHHMMMNRTYMNELFKLVEDYHNNNFFNVYLKSLVIPDLNTMNWSGSADFEIYFSFICAHHLNDISIRELRWDNVAYMTPDLKDRYDYVSWPWYYGTRG